MHDDYLIYDSLYADAKLKGWSGWGGDSRIATGPGQLQRIVEKGYVPQSGRVLELGCGEGHFCRLLAAHGYTVTGIDISKVAIEWASEKQSSGDDIAYVRGDLCQSDVLKAEIYDLIVDGNCLHCILESDRMIFLQNVHRLLSEQGIFFVSSLCSKDGKPSIIYRAHRAYRHVPSVISLMGELEEAQFHVLDSEVRERDEYDHISLFAREMPNPSFHSTLRDKAAQRR
jgi:SAM-dependent methyltransferase